MNRLWVRLSLSISAVIVFVALMPVLAVIMVGPANMVALIEKAEEDDEPMTPQNIVRAIPEFILGVAVFSSLIGVSAGVIISRSLSSQITQLTEATREVGQGKLGHQVEQAIAIQELAALAASFNKMSADLHHAEQLRQVLMADIAHELRTPLTILEGNLRASLDDVYELGEEDVANLYSQIHHLTRLVNDLHLLAQAEAHQLPLHIQVLNVQQIIQEVVANFALSAEEKGVALHMRADCHPPSRIEADAVRLRQILTNLMANALQHTPPDGAVTLCFQAQPDGVLIEVSDSGAGIAPEHISHIFDRFYRVDQSRSRETGGTGLGLAIVKVLTEMHGGWVTAMSAGLGQGTTFTVFLPQPHTSSTTQKMRTFS